MQKVEIEQGVQLIKGYTNNQGIKNADTYLYKLDDMSDEAIARYCLTSVYERYKASKADD
ncbi:hypothetical protein ACLIBH_04925 [Virgibacillus sp. W0430]|uniref:hypothetical protein n=1 Tax=Virgibacillus sp. W0430 TaxID=3391580 RepID=UPI003F467F01